MKAREIMGSSVRTMVKMKVTTDGDQNQNDGKRDYRSVGKRRTTTTSVCDNDGLETVWLCPAL